MSFVPTGYLDATALRRYVPSAFADHPQPGLSDRYQFVNTGAVIEMMADAGYVPVNAGQSKARRADGGMYVKHVVRMMHERYLTKPKSQRAVGDVVPQVIVTNSHNRTSAFHLSAGLFRLVCANGMAVEAAGFASVRVLHNDKNIRDHIIEGTNTIRELTESTVLPQVERMTQLELSAEQEEQFALGATVLKYGDVKPAEAKLLLQVRRDEDAARNLWAVMNRIQENAVKGGYETQTADGRTIVSRGITSVARDLDFNVRLWNFGAKVLESVAA